MLNIRPLVLGDYQTNCYLVAADGSKECCIIDPGFDAPAILRELDWVGWRAAAILLTHGHFDHVGAVRELAAATGCEVCISEEELQLPSMLTGGKIAYTRAYPAEGTLNLAGLTFRVIPTPGHTPGSVCLMTEDVLFSGDTLFQGSCGRTDLPGGSWEDITVSLRKLADLPGDYRVYPGHGSSTTLDTERKYNPYL